jgi:biotin-dependent carboxylase-like uncharacterized protein
MLPGDKVRFIPLPAAAARSVPPGPSDSADPDGRAARDGGAAGSGVEVVRVGVQALVQDLGRPGSEGAGVSASGALDRPSLRAANRAVGNPSDAAAIESVGGLRLRARGPQVLAVTGAACDVVVRPGPGGPDETGASRPDRRPRSGEPFALDDGDELRLAPPTRGVRVYVAVRGGIDVPPVLGSRSTDVLAGLGPEPLGPGDVLPVGVPDRGLPAAGPPSVDAAGSVPVDDRTGAGGAPPSDALPAVGEVTELSIVLGPRDDWFDAAALARLTGQDWLVTPRSNRVGLRLDGEPVARVRDKEGAELPSEGCVTGAIQMPPDGLPVLFLADHPLTGGYPVIGAVVAGHVPLAGQLPAGARVRLTIQNHPGGTP